MTDHFHGKKLPNIDMAIHRNSDLLEIRHLRLSPPAFFYLYLQILWLMTSPETAQLGGGGRRNENIKKTHATAPSPPTHVRWHRAAPGCFTSCRLEAPSCASFAAATTRASPGKAPAAWRRWWQLSSATVRLEVAAVDVGLHGRQCCRVRRPGDCSGR
jgi:hypothetical protein